MSSLHPSIKAMLEAELKPKQSREEEELERLARVSLLNDAAQSKKIADQQGVLAAYSGTQRHKQTYEVATSREQGRKRPNEKFLERIIRGSVGYNSRQSDDPLQLQEKKPKHEHKHKKAKVEAEEERSVDATVVVEREREIEGLYDRSMLDADTAFSHQRGRGVSMYHASKQRDAAIDIDIPQTPSHVDDSDFDKVEKDSGSEGDRYHRRRHQRRHHRRRHRKRKMYSSIDSDGGSGGSSVQSYSNSDSDSGVEARRKREKRRKKNESKKKKEKKKRSQHSGSKRKKSTSTSSKHTHTHRTHRT